MFYVKLRSFPLYFTFRGWGCLCNAAYKIQGMRLHGFLILAFLMRPSIRTALSNR